MSKTAEYRIKISGTVPDTWIDRLGGMQMMTTVENQVILQGSLPDQAALMGVMATRGI